MNETKIDEEYRPNTLLRLWEAVSDFLNDKSPENRDDLKHLVVSNAQSLLKELNLISPDGKLSAYIIAEQLAQLARLQAVAEAASDVQETIDALARGKVGSTDDTEPQSVEYLHGCIVGIRSILKSNADSLATALAAWKARGGE